MTRPLSDQSVATVYVCESAATGDDWRDGRRTREQFATYTAAWDRMNEHLRRGRRAFCSQSIALGKQG